MKILLVSNILMSRSDLIRVVGIVTEITARRPAPWASYQIRKTWVLRMRRECRERFPRHRLKTKPLVSYPGVHHSTYVTVICQEAYGMDLSDSGHARAVMHAGIANIPGIPDACRAQTIIPRIWREAHYIEDVWDWTFSQATAQCIGVEIYDTIIYKWQDVDLNTVYPLKYAHGFVVLWFVVVI